jgi:hypothetical protein
MLARNEIMLIRSNQVLVSTRAVIEPSIKCSSSVHLILFQTRAKLEVITELDNLFKLDSFIFQANSSLFTSCSANLFISYIK